MKVDVKMILRRPKLAPHTCHEHLGLIVTPFGDTSEQCQREWLNGQTHLFELVPAELLELLIARPSADGDLNGMSEVCSLAKVHLALHAVQP